MLQVIDKHGLPLDILSLDISPHEISYFKAWFLCWLHFCLSVRICPLVCQTTHLDSLPSLYNQHHKYQIEKSLYSSAVPAYAFCHSWRTLLQDPLWREFAHMEEICLRIYPTRLVAQSMRIKSSLVQQVKSHRWEIDWVFIRVQIKNSQLCL